MGRKRRYLDVDVLTAARQRVRRMFDIFDTVRVSFSGGKDSLVVLHLVKDEAERRGQLPVKVTFLDEEIIYPEVIAFVDRYRRLDWVEMDWWCYPLESNSYSLGAHRRVVQWDPSREWVRPMPEWGLSLEPGDPRTFNQHDMDHVLLAKDKGSVAMVLGIRAAESLLRYRACVNKLDTCWINRRYSRRMARSRAQTCKPIYDWEEDDVFKYLHDNGLAWCTVYDWQHADGYQREGPTLRVATPIQVSNAKRLDTLKTTAPSFYDAVARVFPDMDAQARLWKDFNREALAKRHGDSYASVRAFVREHLDPAWRPEVLRVIRKLEKMERKRPGKHPPDVCMYRILSGTLDDSLTLPARKVYAS